MDFAGIPHSSQTLDISTDEDRSFTQQLDSLPVHSEAMISPDCTGLPGVSPERSERIPAGHLHELMPRIAGSMVCSPPSDEPQQSAAEQKVLAVDTQQLNLLNDLLRGLRTIPRLIEADLLKRTQWRQEQQKLDHCRGWLSESTDALSTALKTMTRTGTKQSVRQRNAEKNMLLEVLAATIGEAFPVPSPTTKSGGSSAETAGSDRQKLFKLSIDDESVTMGDLTKLHDAYVKDLEAMREQERVVKALVDDMGNSGFDLERRMHDLGSKMKSHDFATNLGAGGPADDHSLSTHRLQSDSVSNTPSIVRDYFERVGDIGIFQDRLLELNEAYEEGLVEREFLTDRGDILPVSDEEFESTHQTRREAVERELQRAQDEANALRQRCLDAGHNPDVHRRSKHPLYASSYAPSGGHDIDQSIEYPHAQVRQVRNPVPLRQAELSSGAARLDNWLVGVSEEAMLPIEADVVSIVDSTTPDDGLMPSQATNSWISAEQMGQHQEPHLDASSQQPGNLTTVGPD